MKKIISLLLMLSTIYVYSQQNFKTEITKEHKQIKGSKVSIIPPQGFTDAIDFTGFQNTTTGSSIMVVDIPGPYSELAKAMTKQSLMTQGVVVKKIEKIDFNGLESILVTGNQFAQGLKYSKFILLFGDESESVMINFISPLELDEIEESMKKSIFSTVYEKNKTVNPFDAVDFKVNIKNTNFKFAGKFSNNLMYTKDGKVPSQHIDNAILMFGKSFSKQNIIDEKKFSLDRIKQYPYQIKEIISIDKIQVDDISGYKIIAKMLDPKTSSEQNGIQVLLFSNNLYYLFFGTSSKNQKNNEKEIMKIINTFERK